jgi:hypothetical protein
MNKPLDNSSRPDDTSRLEEADLLKAYEELAHLRGNLADVTEVEAALQRLPARELRAMVVATIKDQRFEIHTRHLRHDGNPGDMASLAAFDRWAGHLGLGSHLEEDEVA